MKGYRDMSVAELKEKLASDTLQTRQKYRILEAIRKKENLKKEEPFVYAFSTGKWV